MDKKELEAQAAGEIFAPILPETPAFTASLREKIVMLLSFLAAYIYISQWLSGWGLLAFTAAFIAMTEIINWEKPRSWESWIWLGCVVLIAVSISFELSRVWSLFHSMLFLHIFAVWWVLSRSGRLLEGQSGYLLPLDGINGFICFPFKHFFLRIRCLWFSLTHIRKQENKPKFETLVWTIAALAAAAGLFALAYQLLAAADSSFAQLMWGVTELFHLELNPRVCFEIMLSLPVGAYLFGLIAGSAREEGNKLRLKAQQLSAAFEKLHRVPNRLWTVLTGLFCLLYLLFFIVQAGYLFGAFTHSLPEGFIVSQYAREGFFELCKVMAVNFVLLCLVLGTSEKPVRQTLYSKILCAVLLVESMLFAVVAFSKLALYISCFGFTPLRLQSTWLVCVLFAGCVCAMYSIFSGKRAFRAWMIFGAVSLALLHLY